MASTKKIDLAKIVLHHKIWLETPDGKGILGDGKWQILKAIEQTGSLTAACRHLGLTYRRTWGDLKKIEQMLGFQLLEKSRGGKDGGMSCLSPDGKKMVAAFDEFHHSVDDTIEKAMQTFKDKLIALKPDK